MGINRLSRTSNPRTLWYIEHQRFIRWSQLILTTVCILMMGYFITQYFQAIIRLPLIYWIVVVLLLTSAVLYYGMLPSYFFNLNLRNAGWLKPVVIGFVWACTANVLPLIALRIETGIEVAGTAFWIWLFVKNWMFCTVNAIMFDLKDYQIDANMALKTFAVRFGLEKTIAHVLIPLLGIGLLSLGVFTYIMQIKLPIILINAIPFVLTIVVAYSMKKKKPILFYLIVIDGLILVKALCGILAVLLFY